MDGERKSNPNLHIHLVLFVIITAWITFCKGIPLLHVDHNGPVITTVGSDVKLSCSASQWTDGYTITWSKNSSGEVLTKNLHVVADPTKFSITTVTSSELESTTWTLTVKDTSQADSGDYTCSLKTEPPQFVAVSVLVQIPLQSDLPKEVVRWDVSDCCANRNVPVKALLLRYGHCMPLCNTMSSGIDVLGALHTSDRCRQHHDPWFRCLANERNHTPCCRRRHVPDKCLDLCLGNFSTVFREGNLDCLHFVAVIFKCFHEGRESIPSPPRNLRIALIGSDSLRVSWSPPLKHGKEVNYTVFYKAIGESDPGLHRAGGLTKAMSTNALGLIITGLVQGETYKVHVVALNAAGSSLASDTASVDLPRPTPVRSTSLNLEGDLVQHNTTMDSVATLPVESATVTAEVVTMTALTVQLIEMAQLQTVTQLPDDLVLFDRCFGSDEFRTSCSEVLRHGGTRGRNTTVIRCRDSLPRFLSCAADEGDHRKCCGRNAVPQRCLDLCTGRPSGIFDICHVFLPRILTCFREGILFLTSEPVSVTAELRDLQITVQWQPPETNPEMVEQYIVTIEDRKSADPTNITVPRDTHSITIDPLPLDSEYLIYIQTENFHGLSRRSSSVVINTGDLNTVQQQNIQQEAIGGPTAGPAVAIGVSLACVGLVVTVVGAAYCIRRKRGLIGNPVGTQPTPSAMETPVEDKLPKPLNAFYIPGYFGKRGVSQKAGSTSSMSYATSFSLRPRSSNSSEPVYSDVSGAYLWMFGNDKRMSGRRNPSTRPPCSRRASSEQNIYDNNIPVRAS